MTRKINSNVNSSWLRKMIRYNGLKVKDLANKLNIKPNSLSRKIAGERKFYSEEILKLCKYLELTLYQFYKKYYGKGDD